MKRAIVRPPALVAALTNRWIYWKVPVEGQQVFLTFDDGPHPAITPAVLDILKQYGVKATFFCLGKNVEKYPKVFNRILAEGHSVGNHTFSHLNGWKARNSDYYQDVEVARKLIPGDLFRPPYGRISPCQMLRLSKKYRIICWSILSRDYDAGVMPEECFHNVVNNLHPGAVIVFHDSLKASANCLHALPKVLEHLKKSAYQAKPL